jgi:hypothetical protein
MVWDCYCGPSPGGSEAPGDDDTLVQALECDYEKDCTRLYKKIENAEWEDVIIFLDKGYWPGHLFRDTISPADQARTWVTRFQPGTKGMPDGEEKIRWSQLPLHLAVVVGAPYGVVRRLVHLYPKSVQCTDDELMLPLHLAMRHGSSDAVLDLFLGKFPLAVNARGKNNRTPIDCAFRSNKKARARILTTFIEQTKTLEDPTEIEAVKTMLEDKDATIAELQAKLNHLEKQRTLTEFEMSQKVCTLLNAKAQLEANLEQLKHAKEQIEGNLSKMIDEYQAAKLHDDLETEKKIKALEQSAQDLKDAAFQIQTEEAQLRSDLRKIESSIERTSSKEEGGVRNIRVELDRIRSDRFETGLAKAADETEALLESLMNSSSVNDAAAREEIATMRAAIEDLQARQGQVQSTEELAGIKQELANLKEELKTKREAAQAKAELAALKRAINVAVKSLQGRDDHDLQDVKDIVDPMQVSDLEGKTSDELFGIRSEIAVLRKRVQDRQLTNELLRELSEIRIGLRGQLESDDSVTVNRRREIEDGLTEVDKLRKALSVESSAGAPGASHLGIKLDIVSLKEELKEKEAQYKMKGEIVSLKSAIEETARQVEGQKKKDLHAMKSAVEAIESKQHNSRNFVELLAIKKEFHELKLNIVPKAEVGKVKEELTLMRSMLVQQMRENDAKTKEKLGAILEKLELIRSKKIENLKRADFNEVKLEIVRMWKKMAEMEEVILAKEELAALKRQLSVDLSKAKGNNKKELLVVKHTIDSIDLDAIEIKNQDDWNALKKELESVKVDLKKKELRALKRILENELKNPGSKTPEELLAIKDASNSINLFALETATNSELNQLKSQVDAQLNKVSKAGGPKGKKKGLLGMLGLGSRKKNGKTNIAAAIVESTSQKQQPVKTLLPPRVQHNPTAQSSVGSDSSSEDEEDLEQDEFLFGGKKFGTGKGGKNTSNNSIMDTDGAIEVTRTATVASVGAVVAVAQ